MEEIKYLVISEVSKKQAYIFKSNKLKENIGASTIIEYITEDLPEEYRTKYNGENIYSGGGSSLFTFNKEENAKNFISEITIYVLREFPGVEFFMTYVKYDDSVDDIREIIDKIYMKLNEKKNKRQSVFKKISYGIEEKCNTTSYPAYEEIKNIYNNSIEYISREAKVKREWSISDKNKKETTINKILSECSIGKDDTVYKFPLEIEKLGINKGESSYIAIVSLDGNKMGQKLKKFKDDFEEKNKSLKDNNIKEFNNKYIQELDEFSKNIKQYYEESFKHMIYKVIDKYPALKQDKSFNLEEDNIPIRPIILAGDDVCFICNARIALECLNNFIQELNLDTKNIQGMKLHACAGISIVKSSYPFAKAYEIAESLCKSSKAKISEEEDASLIDWHISQGELSRSLREMRNNIKIDENITLHIKPLYINNEEDTKINTYKKFKKELLKLKIYQQETNNKIRRILDVFPQGKENTRLFINKYQLNNIFENGFDTSTIEYGFNGDDCMYFDVIETIDLFENLD